ncbi:hypothetical protein V7183_25820 [Bacillus sp. JJ1127]|uniref:hypothetical protein n=1 Tax=Bacillus sp. JJ1127 TaxID=3122952 RepID=UPI002FFF1590
MLNKFFVGIGIGCLLLSTVAGCSNKQDVNKQEQSKEETKVVFPKGAKETGKINMKLITNNEQQNEEAVPVLKVDPKLELAQVQVELEGLSEKESAYIFVDKKYITKEEAAKVFSTFINLEGDLLKKGEHTVSIAQFKDNDPKKAVTSYKEVKFKIE